jgi:hypothetical protein
MPSRDNQWVVTAKAGCIGRKLASYRMANQRMLDSCAPCLRVLIDIAFDAISRALVVRLSRENRQLYFFCVEVSVICSIYRVADWDGCNQ